jgi:hypothetical protein
VGSGRTRRASVCALAAIATSVVWGADTRAAPDTLFGRSVRLDRDGKLLSWSTESSPYAHVAGLAWQALETKFPPQDNGLETWLAFSRFDPDTFEGVAWPHNPAGLYGMLTDSAARWYAFAGDRAAVRLARKALAYQLAHGTTAADWAWARVPYASAAAGDTNYGGADDTWCDLCGRGDGIGVIEPDKVGELGFAYLQMFELTGDATFRDGAMACADALAKHVRAGDKDRSPWPFRVRAQTGEVREEYCANVIGVLMLFDELGRLGLGDTAAYARARELALGWLLRVPLVNDVWSGYFEDIAIHADVTANRNQYTALRTARWLMTHHDADPRWRADVRHLLDWTVDTFGGNTATERGVQWGARVISEQFDDPTKMASHTASFGATSALWYEATGDTSAREQAARSLDWATYACRDDGVVAVANVPSEGWWFSDGYGDYIRHFLVAMAAVPEWAPRGEDHLLRSTSLVDAIEYTPSRVAWTTFDDSSTDTLRLTFRPTSVLVRGTRLPERDAASADGYTQQALPSGGFLVRVRHSGGGVVVVKAAACESDAPSPPAVEPHPERVGGCAGHGGATILALGALAVARLARRPRSSTPRRADLDP